MQGEVSEGSAEVHIPFCPLDATIKGNVSPLGLIQGRLALGPKGLENQPTGLQDDYLILFDNFHFIG